MSRLDQHVDAVRTRFLIQKLINFGAWALCIAALVLLIVTVLARMLAMPVPPRLILIAGAAMGCVAIALILAIIYSPSREATAVQIDKILGLKERFSTALEARGSADPFAQAAVRDAERAADSVSIRKRFPFAFPRMGFYALGAVLAFAVVDRFLPQFDLLGQKEKQRQPVVEQRQRDQAQQMLKDALAEVMSLPKAAANDKGLMVARKEVEALLSEEIKDAGEAARTARNAMREAEAMRQKIQEARNFANAQTQKEQWKPIANMQPGNSGTLDDARKSLSEGKFDQAAAQLKGAVDKFKNADAATQNKMAQEMKDLAKQLADMSKDPSVQDAMQKQLQKQGATPEQARQITDEMQKAAAGDKDAQQRVKDMVQNLARRQNGGLLPAPEQLAPLMQQVTQMQSKLGTQQQSGELSQAVQQLANAMQQQAQQNQGQQQQNRGQQQGPEQQQAQGGKQAGQQQQQSPSQQGGQQQSGQSGSEMADAQQAMEAALSQLEAQQQAAEMAQAGNGAGEQGQGQGEGKGFGDENGQGQGQQGGQGGKGFGQGPAGPNAGGIGEGARPIGRNPTPYTYKKEVSAGVTDDKGRILGSWFVKADSIKGESREQLKQVITASQRDAADDVDQERVPLQAQKAVRDYFNALQDEK